MNLFKVTNTYRNILRIKTILQVLTKHGFGHIVARLNLATYLPTLTKIIGKLDKLPTYLSEESAPIRSRMVLQELGPTFIKFGQMLSSRPDILSEEFVNELQVLQDRITPFSIDKVVEIIETEFDQKIDNVFLEFEYQALASGSIGQVHRAKLPDGTQVIVKIKRPNVDKTIKTDIAILEFLAELAEKYIEEIKILQPVLIVDEFSKTITKELDFPAEAAYTEKFYNLVLNDKHISSPKVYWEYVTSNIIVLERLFGINIGKAIKLKSNELDFNLLAKRIVSNFMNQYFIWGLFHADPHPGNILVEDTGHINLVDFGMVGHLTEELKHQLSTTILALLRNDLDTIIEIYFDIGVFSGNINRRELKTDILQFLDKYLNIPFKHLDITKIFQELLQMSRKHRIIFPRDFILLAKSFVMIVSLVRDLNPDFNFLKAITPHIAKILREKFSIKKILNNGLFQIWSISSLIQKLPLELKEIIRRLKEGNLTFTLRHDSLEKYMGELHQIANKLSFSIILASIIISSSLLIMSNIGPLFKNIPLFGIIGYGIAIIIFLLLLINIFRYK